MFGWLKTSVATVVGTISLVLLSLLCSLLVVPASALDMHRLVDWLLRCWARSVLFTSGVRLQVGPLPADGRSGRVEPCIVMANHTSIYDIPALIAAVPWRIRMLAKRQLFRIPVFGWAMKSAGFVPVDRGRSRRGSQAFAAARQILAAGTSLVIFPEETRSPDGRLLLFRAGGALLAKATDVPVVPVGIRGALAIRPRNSRIIRPGTISVHYGESLMPADYEHRKQLNEAVRRQIGDLIGQAPEPPAPDSQTRGGADEPTAH